MEYREQRKFIQSNYHRVCTTTKEISDEFYNQIANHTKTLDIDTRKWISNAKEELLTKIRRRKTNDTIKAIFKLIVSYESRPDSFAVCLHWGRYLGCHTCIERLSICPLSRKEFKCVKSSNILQKNNYFFMHWRIFKYTSQLTTKPTCDTRFTRIQYRW